MLTERISNTYADDFSRLVVGHVYDGNKTEDDLAKFLDESVETHVIETNQSRVKTIKLFLFDDGSFVLCQPGIGTPIIGTMNEGRIEV